MSDKARELAKRLGELKLLYEMPPLDDSGWRPGEFDETTAAAEIERYVQGRNADLRAEADALRKSMVAVCQWCDEFAPVDIEALERLSKIARSALAAKEGTT